MTINLKVKNDRYYAVINYKGSDNKYRQKWIALGLQVKNNKRKAEGMLPGILKEFEETFGDTNQGTLFTTYLSRWLEKKRQTVEATTYEGYRQKITNHVIPYFSSGKLKISNITTKDMQDFLDYKLAHGTSSRLLYNIKSVLSTALREAAAQDIIKSNPLDGAKINSKKSDFSDQRVFLTAESANKLLKAFEGHWLQPIVYITLYYGLRRSEVLGLKWDSIDFVEETLTLKHSVVIAGQVIEKDTMKTPNSSRTYALIENVKELLESLYEEYLVKRRNPMFKDRGYIFCNNEGDPLYPPYVSIVFRAKLQQSNLPLMRFHDLRHSTASILYDKGWDLKDIQVWLRHATLSTTSDIYTHISKERKSKMVSDLNGTFKI